MSPFAAALNAIVQSASSRETDDVALKITARTLAQLIQRKYGAALELDADLRMGVKEVLRMTEVRR